MHPARAEWQVDEDEVRFELCARCDQRAVGSNDERIAVEDELVLPSDLVDVGDGAAGLGHPILEHGQSFAAPPPVVGGRVQVDHHVGPGPAGVGHRPVAEPDVLADRHAHPRPGHVEERRGLGPGLEVTLLVEDPVVGKALFAVDAGHPTTGAHGGRVGQAVTAGRGRHEADHDGAVVGGRRHLLERGHVVGHEAGLEEQVLGRVARDGELGDHAEVGAGGLGGGQGAQHLLHVPRQVAHDGVELRGGQAQVWHRPRLPGPFPPSDGGDRPGRHLTAHTGPP